jgi:N-formylglutamate amidohydrolase
MWNALATSCLRRPDIFAYSHGMADFAPAVAPHGTPPSLVRVATPPHDVAAIPLVFDSPHSGRRYPDDFAYACAWERLRRAEDTDVDDLYAFAPSLGATLVAAEFPRSYLDPNRRAEDVDTSLIEGKWPHAVDHSPKTASGIGLIWRVLDDNSPIYARKLSVAEVERRIALCHAPYWTAVSGAVESAYARHGRVVHINCHSMPEVAGAISWVKPGTRFADVVLGDRDGTTCSPEFTRLLADAFTSEGLSVAVNDPYKGVELVKRFGRPAENRHSIQIELNRKLYMNEATRERNKNYEKLQTLLERVMRQVAAFARGGVA